VDWVTKNAQSTKGVGQYCSIAVVTRTVSCPIDVLKPNFHFLTPGYIFLFTRFSQSYHFNLYNLIRGQGKPTARISANVNGFSAFYCLMALRSSTKMTTQLLKAESGKQKMENVYVDLPRPLN
jgi:uncharacterized membrane protein YuzA (DUF378 family)